MYVAATRAFEARHIADKTQELYIDFAEELDTFHCILQRQILGCGYDERAI